MSHIAGKAAKHDSPILHAAIALAPQIRAASDAIEQGRRLPPRLAAAMKEAGIFGMVMPRAWGGPELDPMTQFRVIEALAIEDGSVGWCAMIGCDPGYISAFLDQDVARAMFPGPGPWSAMGAAATPTGTATLVPGGYRVSGRFPFVSGCHHCEWLWLGCHVVEDGTPRVQASGVPETRQCLLRLEECEVLDTWHTTGLRGTGSNDVAVRDRFVPAEHSFSFQDPALVKREGPLYAFPFMFAAKGRAPALGIARHALDTLLETSGKPARRYTLGEGVEAPKRLRDDVFVQEAAARADTLLTTARAHLFAVVGDMWETLVADEPLSDMQVARFLTLNSHVTALCVEIVQLVFKTSGGTAVYQKGPLDRCLRDVLTMNQHVVASLRTWEMSGRLLLGLEPLRWLF
ncbi:MAG TPA: acyl-CoA dehydrogenase family protein [Stellaceae bacterium]|nr:acyl-CoA dehydrogenase family protein [Stellaceae bacterium]